MSTLENRMKALEVAEILHDAKDSNSWQQIATDALTFLETGSFAPAAAPPASPPEGATNPTPAAPKKPRAPKPASVAVVGADTAEVSNAESVVALAPATPATGTSTAAKEPTLDDVRAALVTCQTRKGSKQASLDVLRKHIPAALTNVTGNLPKDKYAAVISECAAA